MLQNVNLYKVEPTDEEESTIKSEIYMEEETDNNSCKSCSESFNKYSEFLKHNCKDNKVKIDQTKSSNNIKLHTCQICNKTFKLLGHLKRHIVVHTGEKHYVCQICERPFSDSSTLRKHSKTHSGDKREKKFKCEICEKTFTQMSHMKTHLLIHTGEKGYECRFCGKTFR